MGTQIGEVLHMQIGHTGRTRVEELIIAMTVLVVAIRAALPIGTTIYGHYWVKVVFAVLIGTPSVLLLLARTLEQRKRALLTVFVTCAYSGVLTVVLSWQAFASAALLLGTGALAGYLYYLTRGEIKWTQRQLSQSPPPDPASLGTSSNE